MSIGNIHKLGTADEKLFCDHLLRLDKKGRRLRFGHSVSDSFIEKYTKLSSDVDSVIYGFFVDDILRGVSELRPLADSWGDMAEAAFSVEPGFQDLGIATELMGRIIRSARNRNVGHLYISCLAENRKMQRIAKKYDAQLRFEHGEVLGEILPEHRTIGSVLSEKLDDEIDHLMTVLHLDGASKTANGRNKEAA